MQAQTAPTGISLHSKNCRVQNMTMWDVSNGCPVHSTGAAPVTVFTLTFTNTETEVTGCSIIDFLKLSMNK